MPKARIGLPRTRPGYASPRMQPRRAGPAKPPPKRVPYALLGLIAVAVVCVAWFAFGRRGNPSAPQNQGTASTPTKIEKRQKVTPKETPSATAGGFLVG